MLLLLLAAIVGSPAVAAERDLAAYLALATRYRSGQRVEALAELRTWGPSEFDAAIAAIRRREDRLRARTELENEIDFGNVESAVLLHAEAGLLALVLRSDSGVDAERQLQASVTLYEWSRAAAGRLQKRASRPGRQADLLRIRERIAPRDYYAALAATSLAFGIPLAARSFAQDAVRSAPLDAEAHLISGCAAESLAETFALRHQDSDAERSRDDAGRDLRDALAIDPGLVEARLHLGNLLLRQRRAVEAESLLAAVDEGSADDRQRYLARLFLGRVADRRGRRAEAAGWYRRAHRDLARQPGGTARPRPAPRERPLVRRPPARSSRRRSPHRAGRTGWQIPGGRTPSVRPGSRASPARASLGPGDRPMKAVLVAACALALGSPQQGPVFPAEVEVVRVRSSSPAAAPPSAAWPPEISSCARTVSHRIWSRSSRSRRRSTPCSSST